MYFDGLQHYYSTHFCLWTSCGLHCLIRWAWHSIMIMCLNKALCRDQECWYAQHALSLVSISLPLTQVHGVRSHHIWGICGPCCNNIYVYSSCLYLYWQEQNDIYNLYHVFGLLSHQLNFLQPESFLCAVSVYFVLISLLVNDINHYLHISTIYSIHDELISNAIMLNWVLIHFNLKEMIEYNST